MKEYEPNEISAEEAGRLLVTQHRSLFRATDEELYKCIPADVEKILVIDEWYHRDFYQHDTDALQNLSSLMNAAQISEAFQKNAEKLSESNISKEGFLHAFDFENQRRKMAAHNDEEWNLNRPGSYETWQQIAKVIVTGDTSFYHPTVQPNSHWSHWPDAGTM